MARITSTLAQLRLAGALGLLLLAARMSGVAASEF